MDITADSEVSVPFLFEALTLCVLSLQKDTPLCSECLRCLRLSLVNALSCPIQNDRSNIANSKV